MSKEIVSFVIGALLGAFISVRCSIRARSPKLLFGGIAGGGGGNRSNRVWSIAVSNRPSFLGQYLEGEEAQDVRAHILVDDKKSQAYPIYWGDQRNISATIRPGDQQYLEVFRCYENAGGYFFVDNNGNPVRNFQDREIKFVIILTDKLRRKTKLKFKVDFDDTHLQKGSILRIIRPFTLRDRLEKLDDSWQEFKLALKIYS